MHVPRATACPLAISEATSAARLAGYVERLFDTGKTSSAATRALV